MIPPKNQRAILASRHNGLTGKTPTLMRPQGNMQNQVYILILRKA